MIAGVMTDDGLVITEPVASHGYPDSVRITLPPLSCLLLKPPAKIADDVGLQPFNNGNDPTHPVSFFQTNQVDLAAAAEHGIAVFNAPYSNTVPGRLCQTAAATFSAASAAPSDTRPSEWFRKCAQM